MKVKILKECIKYSMIFTGLFINQHTLAEIFSYKFVENSCQTNNSVPPIVICKASYVIEMPNNTNEKIWIKSPTNMFISSSVGSLRFSSTQNPNIQGTFSINNGDISKLSTDWQKITAFNPRQPLKLDIKYEIQTSNADMYFIPEIQPLTFKLEENAEEHQVIIQGFSISQPAICSFRNKKQNIQLLDIKTNNIRKIGDMHQAGSFSLQIDCNTANTHIAMAFTDATTPSNTSDILTIKNDNKSAKGVGLKIFYDNNNNPISFSPQPASFINKSPQQWELPITKSHFHQSNFHIYYINTSGKIIPGEVTGGILTTIAFK